MSFDLRGVACALLVTVALLFIGTDALAQAAKARPHLRAAAAAATAKDWAKALDEYSAAWAADPSNAALEGVARSQYELHHDVDAFDSYTQLATRSRRPDAKVKARLAELSQRTGTLTVAVKDTGADVQVDDVSVGTSPLEVTRRLPVGRHVVRAKPATGAPVEQTVDVAGGATARVELAIPPPEKPKPTEHQADADGGAPVAVVEADAGAGADAAAPPSDNAWDIPHGSKFYTAYRTDTPPTIDGNLDDRVWQLAPRDTRFFDVYSKPFGMPGKNPTAVQVAYDDRNLYVAFRCEYAKPGSRDNSFPQDEVGVAAEADSVAVVIDALHNHTSAYGFVVTRAGARADVEITDSGQNFNLDWRGIWAVDVKHQGKDTWTAEFKIPWGTMRMPTHNRPFDIGIQFRRRDPTAFETDVWALSPPGNGPYDINYFGHLEGLHDIRPGQRLYLQPYVALAYESDPAITSSSTTPSPLTDFTLTQSNFRAYAGLYARYQPPGPLRVEATFNPNYATVTPDLSTANFDRFELAFPEARPFFAEDSPRFNFNGGAPQYQYGDFAAQMFYSRRIGYNTDPRTLLTQVVPILWGAKSVLRTDTTDIALMNVGLAPASTTLAVNDVVTVARARQRFGNGSYVGGIFLNREGNVDSYAAGGPDALITMFDRHLAISGFYAATWSKSLNFSGGGSVAVQWNSREFQASAAYFDFGTNFDAQLGYFPITGVRADILTMGYTPVIKSDLVQQFRFEGQFTHLTNRNDDRIYDRGVVSATAELASRASIQVAIFPSAEHVVAPFQIGSCAGTLATGCAYARNPVIVQPGDYTVNYVTATVSTPPRRLLVGTLSYRDGDLFGGHLRAPSLDVQLNLGRFAAEASYTLDLIHYGSDDFAAHVLNASATLFYTQLAKSTLAVTWSTLNENAVAQLITSYTFGQLSTVSLALRNASGSTATLDAIDWFDRPAFSAILQFALGITPF